MQAESKEAEDEDRSQRGAEQHGRAVPQGKSRQRAVIGEDTLEGGHRQGDRAQREGAFDLARLHPVNLFISEAT